MYAGVCDRVRVRLQSQPPPPSESGVLHGCADEALDALVGERVADGLHFGAAALGRVLDSAAVLAYIADDAPELGAVAALFDAGPDGPAA